MIRLLAMWLFAFADAYGFQPVPVTPPGTTPVALSDVQFLKLENVDLKVQLIHVKAILTEASRESVMNEVCKQVGFWDCQFNLQTRTVTETPRPPKATPPAHPPEQNGSSSTDQQKKKKPKKEKK